MKRFSSSFVAALIAGSLCACGSDGDNHENDPLDDDVVINAALSDLDALLEGAPKNSELRDEPKADQVFPAQFDLMATQSPVRDQGYRGVCSIFSTVALMEHLYKKEGTIENPDFSEQYLQWSVKNQHKKFTTSGGSNATYNLEAIAKYGIVAESDWRYEDRPWSHSSHPECSGDCDDNEPVACYTNGEPPEAAKSARLWKLPKSTRYVNSKPQNIKAYMYGTGNAVISGGQFFYQGWNHGGSNLRVNKEYSRQGYVLYPNDADKEYSNAHRAGHSYLLVGWDDNLEVPIMDKNGQQVLDENGNPKVEKGFWLFKNSWGTDSFGIKNPKGAGYGWISYKYVEEFGSIAVADEPKLEPEICDDGKDNNGDNRIDCEDPKCAEDPVCVIEPEICGDGKDNDKDGDFDCDDSDCADAIECTAIRMESTKSEAIPDGYSEVLSDLEFEGEGVIKHLRVTLDITHPYRRDLAVTLYSPCYWDGGDDDCAIELYDGKSDPDRNAVDLKQTFESDALNGKIYAGDWILRVADDTEGEEGVLNSWSLEVVPEAASK